MEKAFSALIFFYHFLWTGLIALSVPAMAFAGKKRISERLAVVLPPPRPKQGSVWIHALSVGEVFSAIPLVDAIRARYPEKSIVFTVTTRKGMSIAIKELQGRVDTLLTMPLDLWYCARRMVNYLRPGVFILVETDIWPGLIEYLRKKGIKSILVNGRISPRTFSAYKRFSFFARMMFQPLSSCLMQSDLDTDRLLKVGVDPAKVHTVGNIKFDRDWPPMNEEEHGEWLDKLKLNRGDLLWVAGSIHRGEDELILSVYLKLKSYFPSLRLILAPRRVEESPEILKQAKAMGLRAVLRTEPGEERYDVLVVDTLGELARIYGLGKVSFVGGSLVPFGGHNLLEPAQLGVPVIFGPYTHNFVFMSESMTERGAGWRVRNAGELYEAVFTLLENDEVRHRMCLSAKEFVSENRGAISRVISYVDAALKGTQKPRGSA